MKKLFILAVVVSFSTASMAQGNIKKGDWMVGGDVGFNSAKTDSKFGSTTSNSNESTVNFSPNVAHFFIDQLAGGIRFNVATSTSKYGTPRVEDKETFFLVGPFLRYYFLPATAKTNIFLDGGYSFGNTKYTPPSGSDSKTKMNGYSFTGGVACFLTPSVALEFGLGYSSLKDKSSGSTTTYSDTRNTFGLNIGFQIHLAGKGGGMQKIDK